MYRICGCGDEAVVCLLMEAVVTVIVRRSGGPRGWGADADERVSRGRCLYASTMHARVHAHGVTLRRVLEEPFKAQKLGVYRPPDLISHPVAKKWRSTTCAWKATSGAMTALMPELSTSYIHTADSIRVTTELLVPRESYRPVPQRRYPGYAACACHHGFNIVSCRQTQGGPMEGREGRDLGHPAAG